MIVLIAGRRAWLSKGKDVTAIQRTMFAVLSLGLLAKMLLNARIAQYGFALAMPAAMLLVDTAIGSGPRWIVPRRCCRRRTRSRSSAT